ncbi:50S ribosomal protein L4 [Texas Phoenix palm phytoplasma]|uniref:Large ribosomal subunit protein uL4 n=1 Tax=Texas Phoenix palm phytoplasma TaxID=176709 RepID=A0ABS5BIK7_9MOLU|nr:50S ribosomal protein L4 [Texas Phoenix palm phytoplasma]MBP3059418.1 50S ribosomal protein L4 [Texas Phoenix palm phytoplasma]
MPKCNVLNQQGEFVSEIYLLDEFFGVKPNKQVLYDVVNSQRAALRQGTHSTKNRSAVRGGGRKPYPQKGTGNARHGTIRSPLWRGGGVVFGPKPRKYSLKVNYKVKKIAIKSAFSWQLEQGNLIIIDSFKFENPKTKYFYNFLKKINLNTKNNRILVIVKELNDNLLLSTNNLSGVNVESVKHVSVYQLLKFKKIIISKECINFFEKGVEKK